MNQPCRSQRKILSFIIVLLFVFSPLFSVDMKLIEAQSIQRNGKNQNENIIFVDQRNANGPWTGSEQYPLQRISEAITMADPYDTIFIQKGIYNETLQITFPIRLIGNQLPVIDGRYNHTVLSVLSSDVYISNLCISHSNGYENDAGVYIKQSTNVTISNCIIHHTKTGIFLNESNQILINDSWIFHSGNAIRSDHSSTISIISCDFARNSIGLLMIQSSNILLNFSVFIANGISCYFDHSSNICIKQCNISDNSVNKGGFFFSDSCFINLTNTLFYHNGVGISFSNVSSTTIDSCEFIKNTHFALSFREPSKQIQISYCLIHQNIRNGLYVESDNACTISHSHLTDNMLYSVIADSSSFCDAQQNWWGHPFGPFFSLINRSNKITIFKAKIIFFPWQYMPIPAVGIKRGIPSPRYNHTFDEEIIIISDDLDTDNDHIPDWWEEKWGYSIYEKDNHASLDPDKDGLNNIQEWYTDEYGSHPFQKDIFLELDWMCLDNGTSNKPETIWLQKIIDSYAEHNITLHIDLGNLGGGEEINYLCDNIPTYAALEDMYWKYFLDNDLQNPRKNIFHYGLLCNYCPDLNFPFVGWNSLDSFAISVEWLVQSYPQYQRQQLITGGIAHHLGHTLGLIADTYLGIDNIDTLQFFSYSWWNFLNYRSCMNYFYKYREFSFSDGSDKKGDFNDWSHLDFTFFQKGIYDQYL